MYAHTYICVCVLHIFEYVMHIYDTYMYIKTMKEATNLKKSKEGYIGGFGKRKKREERCYNLKNIF